MNGIRRQLLSLAFLSLVVGCLGLVSGCATTGDTENLSERPWNAPKNWEGGLPAGMMEGR